MPAAPRYPAGAGGRSLRRVGAGVGLNQGWEGKNLGGSGAWQDSIFLYTTLHTPILLGFTPAK